MFFRYSERNNLKATNAIIVSSLFFVGGCIVKEKLLNYCQYCQYCEIMYLNILD